MEDEKSKIGFYSKGIKIKEIGLYQNPRGIRDGANRPDIVVIDCYVVCDHTQMKKMIDYLIEINLALERK